MSPAATPTTSGRPCHLSLVTCHLSPVTYHLEFAMPGTLNDIAESLNVSVSLVSKVLSGRLGNTTARDNVVDAIRRRATEIGYVKNSAAAGLATGRQNAIGVYLHHHGALGSGLAEAVIEGVAAEARRTGLRLDLT